MKSLIVHTKKFQIKSIRKSNRPKDIISISNQKNSFIHNSIIVAFVTIEKNDTENQMTQMSEEIFKVFDSINGKNENSSIIIVPFAHLSNNLERPKIANKMLNNLYDILSHKLENHHLYLGDFGYNNEWGLEAYSHPISCVYRET